MIFNTNNFPIQMAATKDPKREISISSIDDKKHKQHVIPLTTTTTTTTTTTEGADGSSIEITKRPRGRPPGSKNKPKPPVIITRETDPASAMRPHVLEIPPSHDLIAALVSFSRRKNLGLCVLAATGAVSNVTIRQPPHPAVTDVSSNLTATVGFGGRFEILSMSATVMPPSVSAVNSSSAAVLLAGPQGQVIGGTVVGPLVAAGTVTVVAAAFENPAFQRLPAVDEVEVSVSVSEGEENLNRSQQQRQQQQQQVEVQEQEQAQQQHYVHHREYPHQSRGPGGDSCAVFSTHFTADVIWPPAAARPPHY